MKKIISLLLVFLIIFSFSACSKNNEDTQGNSSDNQNSSEISSAQVSSEETSSEQTSSEEQSKPYLADFVNKTVGEAKSALGFDFKFSALEGSSVMYSSSPDIFFILDDYYENPSDSCTIVMAVSQDSTLLVKGLSGTMTYGEISAAVGSSVTLGQPEYWYNEMDGVFEYTLYFDYQGVRISYLWHEDPNTAKSIEATARKLNNSSNNVSSEVVTSSESPTSTSNTQTLMDKALAAIQADFSGVSRLELYYETSEHITCYVYMSGETDIWGGAEIYINTGKVEFYNSSGRIVGEYYIN